MNALAPSRSGEPSVVLSIPALGAERPGSDRWVAARVRDGRIALLAFAAACVGVVLVRTSILASAGVPPGVDGGNWLAFGHSLMGDGVRPASLVYPPAVPLLVIAATTVLGPTAGIAFVAGTSAAAPAAGAFLVLRWAGTGSWAAVIAALLLPASALGEMAAWGGYPQLLAAPLVVVALWQLDRWLRSGERTALIGASVAGALVLSASHFTALIGAGAGVSVLICHLVAARRNRLRVLRRAAAGLGLFAVLALPLVPIYARLVPAVVASRAAEPLLATIQLSEVPGRFAEIHGWAWPVWAVGVGAAVVGLAARRNRVPDALWVVVTGLGCGLVAALLLTREPRVLYEVPMLVALGLGLWVRDVGAAGRRRSHRPAARQVAWVAAALLMVGAAGVADLARDRQSYAVLDPHLLEALRWIETESPEGSLVAVASLRDAPLGWWVEGLAGRPTLSAAPLRWLTFPEERSAAARANRLFFVVGLPSAEGMRQAGALGVDYVLLPKGSFAYDHDRVRDYLGTERPAFENRGAVILAVPSQPAPDVSADR